ncbi:MAG: phosphotransferase family protein [Myxococcota bacterium]
MDEPRREVVPELALDWVARATGGRVLSSERLPGGLASSVSGVRVGSPSGASREFVLRRFTREDWTEPDLARREATALRAVAGLGVATPSLVAVDETGEAAGFPAVLMTRLPGRPQLAPSDVAPWLRSLAAILPALHDAASARAGLVREYAPYTAAGEFRVPGWAQRRGSWERALEVLGEGLPDCSEVAIHRDFHPANVLFDGGVVSGWVDWTNACRGPGGVDVAHCRLNLAALLGPDVAAGFAEAWQAEGGETHDPRWDVLQCLDVGWDGYPPWDELGAHPPALAVQRARVEEHVCRLVAHC